MKNIRIIQTLAWGIVIGAALALFLTLLPDGQNQGHKVSGGTKTSVLTESPAP